MLEIRNKIGIKEDTTSGIDCLELAMDKEHFLNYPKKITYRYNSRGFRDNEWPEDLSNVIWCVGDSFTVGIGQPFEDTWPQVLGSKLNRTCLNIGEQGCSNDTIALRIKEIYKLYNPTLIVVMWSYLSRRRINGVNRDHDKNDFGMERDLANFSKNFKKVNELPTTFVNLTIPYAFDDMTVLKKNYPDLITTRQLDYARDHCHFGSKTSTGVCGLIVKKINHIDNSSKYPI